MSAMVETMAYANEVPWHGLGVKVSDKLSPNEMRVKAGLDWTVSLQPLYINGGGKGKFTELQGHRAYARDSDGRLFDIVGSKFTPFQNAEAMDFFTKFVKAGSMKMETAGSLRNGQYIWCLARINHDFKIGKDQLLSYMLMMLPHKLGRAMIFQTTAIRVVCWNTLNMALGSSLKGNGTAYRVPHLAAFDDDAKARAEEALGLATEQLSEFKAAVTVLSKTRVDDAELKTFFKKVLRVNDNAAQDSIVNAANTDVPADSRRLKALLEAYEAAPGQNLAGAAGTLWGAVNAVTYVVDHQFGRTADARLSKAWFGSGARMKRRALTTALSMVA